MSAEQQEVKKKVVMTLVGQDSNIFSLMGLFSIKARRQGWSKSEIENVTESMMQADNYDAALAILINYTEEEE